MYVRLADGLMSARGCYIGVTGCVKVAGRAGSSAVFATPLFRSTCKRLPEWQVPTKIAPDAEQDAYDGSPRHLWVNWLPTSSAWRILPTHVWRNRKDQGTQAGTRLVSWRTPRPPFWTGLSCSADGRAHLDTRQDADVASAIRRQTSSQADRW